MRTFSFMSHRLELFSRISRASIILLFKKERIMTPQTSFLFNNPPPFKFRAERVISMLRAV